MHARWRKGACRFARLAFRREFKRRRSDSSMHAIQSSSAANPEMTLGFVIFTSRTTESVRQTTGRQIWFTALPGCPLLRSVWQRHIRLFAGVPGACSEMSRNPCAIAQPVRELIAIPEPGNRWTTRRNKRGFKRDSTKANNDLTPLPHKEREFWPADGWAVFISMTAGKDLAPRHPATQCRPGELVVHCELTDRTMK